MRNTPEYEGETGETTTNPREKYIIRNSQKFCGEKPKKKAARGKGTKGCKQS